MDAHRHARLRWRCRRGMYELDLLLMRYMDNEFATATAAQRAAFERLLAMQDPDILRLVTGRVTAADRSLDDVVKRLCVQH